MFANIGRKLKNCFWRVGYIPKIFIIVPVLTLTVALVIRLSTGGTHIVYNALGGRGIFPGPFLYALFYIVRTILFSIVLSFSLFSFKVYRERFRCVIFAVIACILHLLEYKLIFGGVSLILAMFFCAMAAFLTVVTVITIRIKYRFVSVIMLIYAFLQLLHFIELISLSVCI